MSSSWPTGSPMPSAATRSRSSSPASCCRTSPACRCWPTWRRCATSPQSMGKNPKTIEPLVPVDLVVDHSVMIDHYGSKKALDLNMKLEFQRNQERYQFMKWGMQAFDTFGVVPPGFGIVHQVNLEYLARGVHKRKDGVVLPRFAGRHRQPHDDDQRHRRGRLGRRRHRGRSRHARPAGVLPDARRGRLRTDRQAARRRHRHRPRADGDRDPAPAQGGRQVRRVLRRRHRARWPCPTAQPSPTWRPSTARRWASSRSTSARSNTSGAPAARNDEIDAFESLLQGAEDVRRADGRRDRLHQRRQARSVAPSPRLLPARSARRTASRSRTCRRSSPSCSARRLPTTASTSRPSKLSKRYTVPAAGGNPARQQRQGRPGAPRDVVEMVDNRSTLSAAHATPKSGAGAPDPGQRRRADRRHHQLHQHQQPERAAGGRPAGQEGGRSRPEGGAAHQDLARPGLAHRHRIPDQGRLAALPGKARLRRGRLWLHDLHRQCR